VTATIRALTLLGDRKLELAEVPAPPPPAAGEVQIAVKAVALNHIDVWGFRGMAFAKRKMPLVVGAEAAGEIVAWTEDHCLPAPDWCEKIREAHERNPDAEMIGGAVVNGSQDNPMDWANFLCTFGPFVPPIKRPPGQRVPAVANLSMKRRAIPSGPIRAGFIEIVCAARLLLAGRVRFDDRIQVTHVQSWGFWGTFAAHFHNGRSTNGLLADTMPPWKRFHQTMICFLMPAGLMWTSVTPLLGKAGVPWARHLPFMFALAVVFSVGGFVGVAGKGAGRSPHFLE
jgi:hypothetical protein